MGEGSLGQQGPQGPQGSYERQGSQKNKVHIEAGFSGEGGP